MIDGGSGGPLTPGEVIPKLEGHPKLGALLVVDIEVSLQCHIILLVLINQLSSCRQFDCQQGPPLDPGSEVRNSVDCAITMPYDCKSKSSFTPSDS